MAPEAEDIVIQMIRRCKDSFQVVRHKRNTRLNLEKKPYSLKRDLKKGDALIVFSKKSAALKSLAPMPLRAAFCGDILRHFFPFRGISALKILKT